MSRMQQDPALGARNAVAAPRTLPSARIYRRLPPCDVEGAREGAPTTSDLEDGDLYAILRQRLPEGSGRRETKLFPQCGRRDEFPIPARQARFKFVYEVTHRGMAASSQKITRVDHAR